MAKKQTSPLLQQHLQDLATKDFETGLPERPPAPQRPQKLQKPMSHAMTGQVFVDGQFVGPTPPEWTEPRHKKISTTPALEENRG